MKQGGAAGEEGLTRTPQGGSILVETEKVSKTF